MLTGLTFSLDPVLNSWRAPHAGEATIATARSRLLARRMGWTIRRCGRPRWKKRSLSGHDDRLEVDERMVLMAHAGYRQRVIF